MMERGKLLVHLAAMDEEIKHLRNAMERSKDVLEMAVRERTRFARANCVHAQTYERSVMGREYERRCKDCDVEL